MTAAAVLEHVGPWTEEDYLALGESTSRIELLDGSLIVSPAPSVPHQQIARHLANALEASTNPELFTVAEGVNVRLRAGRIVIPDVVVAHEYAPVTFEAAQLSLVVEVVSPGNAAADRVLKMQLYALAGIPRYLLAEQEQPDGLTLRLFRLDDQHYVEEAVAKTGEKLLLPAPFTGELDVSALLGRRTR